MRTKIRGLVFVGFAAAIFAASAHAEQSDAQTVTSKQFTEATYEKKAEALSAGTGNDVAEGAAWIGWHEGQGVAGDQTKQWVKLDNNTELLDMPGVLWPKFEDQSVAVRLAFTGAISDDILDIETLAMKLLSYLAENYPNSLTERYKIELSDEDTGLDLLEKVGKKRGMMISGGEINTERAAITVLDEFRSGKLGRITLEAPPQKEQ